MKILFTDLDGTLLTEDKRISETDMRSIRAMIDAGHKFVMTTGRPLTSVKQLAEQYGFLEPGSAKSVSTSKATSPTFAAARICLILR